MMKTAPIIYIDEDVRPDLLSEKERSRFFGLLSNEDRRDILDMPCLRMDGTGNGYTQLCIAERAITCCQSILFYENLLDRTGIYMRTEYGMDVLHVFEKMMCSR